MTRPRMDATVSTPTPPISTPMNTNTCPSGDQNVAMSTVDRPVTQMTETAVNSASTSGAGWPDVVAIGSEKSPVNTRTSAAKMVMAKRAGVAATKASTWSWILVARRLCRIMRLPRARTPATWYSWSAATTVGAWRTSSTCSRTEPAATCSGCVLERGESSVSELVERLELSQPTVSKHLKVLRDHELVGVREDGQHRYRLQADGLEEVEDWLIPFLSADFDESDAAGAAVFAAWSGAEVGDTVGRRLAEGRSALGTLPKRIRRRLFRR